VSGGRVDGGAAPPQRVEPRHEGRIVLKTVFYFSRKNKILIFFTEKCFFPLRCSKNEVESKEQRFHTNSYILIFYHC